MDKKAQNQKQDASTLYIVPCSGTKSPDLRKGAMPAAKAYTGQAFRLAVEWLLATRQKWVILSARYGIMYPWYLVEWYDERLTHQPQKGEWIGALDGMPPKQYGRLMSYDRYVCLGGKLYVAHAAAILERPVEGPLAGLSIGKQLQALKYRTWKGQPS